MKKMIFNQDIYYKIIREERSANLYDYIPEGINFLKLWGFNLIKDPRFEYVKMPAYSLFPDEDKERFDINLVSDKTTRKSFKIR